MKSVGRWMESRPWQAHFESRFDEQQSIFRDEHEDLEKGFEVRPRHRPRRSQDEELEISQCVQMRSWKVRVEVHQSSSHRFKLPRSRLTPGHHRDAEGFQWSAPPQHHNEMHRNYDDTGRRDALCQCRRRPRLFDGRTASRSLPERSSLHGVLQITKKISFLPRYLCLSICTKYNEIFSVICTNCYALS
ncbi:hypothetical protein Mp_8g18300 [Marchantia polymorpha subsp. ruderalis]|uniref:Uncharacterized protein n=1 Tax=Marchantia polymorpha TaxID=3197 RepID=A0A2R6W058_MARPO|nr:hypothetical protein MARPO_0213s0015 [Marchantia polymorpha]BBN20332.1 hypothetical protein Mp_8g18300 [Marchantia polymorpha subsp. ruderalis]|eukprot:PTQ27221.1 hypothetical protein MARPO_0213s0015 [Marchantia polymorpha]